MSTKRSSDEDKNGPDSKRPKIENEDDFPYGKRIAILQSYGKTVCHVPTDELQKIMTLGAARRRIEFEEVSIRVYDFSMEKSKAIFLAHWIHHRDAGRAIKAARGRQTETEEAILDEKWLSYLINAINFFEGAEIFTCDIVDSLIDEFLAFLERGGLSHIDQVFASVFIHRKKQFAQQDPTCDYDRAVQKHMQQWLADVLVNDGDWNRLPSQFQEPSEGRDFDECFHRKHGKDRDCYYLGGILNRG